ncbi:MAG: hypothetical protein DRH17_09110 [Deltaproteobacteria bacterium]|nr:MAG: hypothetical protein DRH17_09110 [Deltaproteobacteria bacterium]
MVTRITKRAKCYTYEKERIVIIFCPRINECTHNSCSTFRKYDKLGYDIICLNPSFYRVEDRDRILGEALEKRKVLKNELDFKG